MGNDHRVDWAKWISIGLTIASAAAIAITRVRDLEKENDTRKEQVRILQNEVAALRGEREGLSKDVVAIKVHVEQLGKDMSEVKGDVREINGKLQRRRP